MADLHYGFELTMRRAGGLFPNWGMREIESRLNALIAHYEPDTLILAGDLMDSHGCAGETLALLGAMEKRVPRMICLEGNHERPALLKQRSFQLWHREGPFLFHHGHAAPKVLGCADAVDGAGIQVTGHWHPAVTLNDGAGTKLKLPALMKRGPDPMIPLEHWVLPAFSPWARGGRLSGSPTASRPDQEVWACHARRVFRVAL